MYGIVDFLCHDWKLEFGMCDFLEDSERMIPSVFSPAHCLWKWKYLFLHQRFLIAVVNHICGDTFIDCERI